MRFEGSGFANPTDIYMFGPPCGVRLCCSFDVDVGGSLECSRPGAIVAVFLWCFSSINFYMVSVFARTRP